MHTPFANPVHERAIACGRAWVRLIEAADLLLEGDLPWTERLLLRLVRSRYTRRLRDLVALCPPDVTAEILAASERLGGPVRGFSSN